MTLWSGFPGETKAEDVWVGSYLLRLQAMQLVPAIPTVPTQRDYLVYHCSCSA